MSPFLKIPNESYWLAKTTQDNLPGCTVWEHSVYVGMIARAIRRRLAPQVQALIPPEAVTLAACHDIGKISPGFLLKIYKALHKMDPNFGLDNPAVIALLECSLECSPKFESDHAVTGMISLSSLNLTREKWAQVIGEHHGKSCKRSWEKADNSRLGGPQWQEARKLFVERLIEKFGALPLGNIKPTKEQYNLSLALIVFADWLGSDERFLVNGHIPPESDMEQHVENVLNDIQWIPPQPCNIPVNSDSFETFFGNNYVPNDVQRRIFEIATAPGIYIIEAPMGLGKTEAALWGAWRLIQKGFHQGMYFALPTRTTSDKIHERVEVFLNNAFKGDWNARLLHSTAWMRLYNLTKAHKRFIWSQTREQGETEHQRIVGSHWFEPAKRGLLQPFAVGTIDQSLMGILPIKHSFLRLFGLAGKVVILDEVHSYDLYSGTLLNTLIEQLAQLGASVIILSATLTRKRRGQLLAEVYNYSKEDNEKTDDSQEPAIYDETVDPYPLLTAKYSTGKIAQIATVAGKDQTVYLSHKPRDLDKTARTVVQRAEKGELVLCVMNTVNRAQDFYKKVLSEMKDGFPMERVGLLHSRFPLARREELETKCLAFMVKTGIGYKARFWSQPRLWSRVSILTQIF